MKFMIKRRVKGDFGGLEGDERGWKEDTEKVELASGKDYYSSEKAGFEFWEWRERCWSPTTAGHPSLLPASLPSPDRHRHKKERKPFDFLNQEPLVGFKPTTPRLQITCSGQLS